MAKKGCIPWNKGKKGVQKPWNKGLAKENDKRIKSYSEKKKGIPLSEEHKRKISKSKIGVKRKPLTKEHKRKISESNKGKHKRRKTREEKQYLSEILKGRKAPTRHTYMSLAEKYPMLFEDHVIRSCGDFIEVKCTHCKNWFIPSRQDLAEKLRQIKTGNGLRFLFCSNECKKKVIYLE